MMPITWPMRFWSVGGTISETTRSRPRTRRLAVRHERLEGPGRGGVELGPIDLLLQPVERLVADRALLAQPVQRQSLGRDRAQAEPVVLGRALWLLRARGHLARGEVPFADGHRRGRALSHESVERCLHDGETSARDLSPD